MLILSVWLLPKCLCRKLECKNIIIRYQPDADKKYTFPTIRKNMRAHNLCSPPFLGQEVIKAVFACVCLEKGGFLDFFNFCRIEFFQT